MPACHHVPSALSCPIVKEHNCASSCRTPQALLTMNAIASFDEIHLLTRIIISATITIIIVIKNSLLATTAYSFNENCCLTHDKSCPIMSHHQYHACYTCHRDLSLLVLTSPTKSNFLLPTLIQSIALSLNVSTMQHVGAIEGILGPKVLM